MSIDEMARATRVASRFLEALEREDFDALPAPVFTKGYIRAYCQAIGIAGDEALARYASSSGLVVAAPTAPAAPPAAKAATDNARRARGTLLVSFVLLVGFGVALFVVALFLQSGRPEIGTRRVETPPKTPESQVASAGVPESPVAAPSTEVPPPSTDIGPPSTQTPSPSTQVPPSPTQVPSPSTQVPPSPTPLVPPVASAPAGAASPGSDVRSLQSGPPESRPAASAEVRPALEAARADVARPAPESRRVPPEPARPAVETIEPPPLRLAGVAPPYRLTVRVSETTWLRVRTEDGRGSEETIPAGEVREWVSNRPFVLTVGNAAGVSFELNGRKLPPLGGRGAVISRLVLPPPEP